MSIRDTIKIYYDVPGDVLRDSSGNVLQVDSIPRIFYAQQAVINLQLVRNSSMDAYTGLRGDEVFEASLDREFNSCLRMMQTLDSGINQEGDWVSGGSGTANPTLGQLSIRVNALTTGFLYKMGARTELPGTRLEVLARDQNGNVMLVFRFRLRAMGLITPVPLLPDATPQGNFQWFNDPVTGAQGLRIVNDDGEVLSVLYPVGV